MMVDAHDHGSFWPMAEHDTDHPRLVMCQSSLRLVNEVQGLVDHSA